MSRQLIITSCCGLLGSCRSVGSRYSVVRCLANVSGTSELQQSGARFGQTAVNKKTSKAMTVYREVTKKHEEFMKKQLLEYDIGKRHLANMMGEDGEHFTQTDIDRSIRYLFPTGIFDKRARPMMKHPSDVFPKQKKPMFDEAGRPHHYLFYTLRPNFSQTLHTIVDKLNALDSKLCGLLTRGLLPDSAQTLLLMGSEWLTAEQLRSRLLEKVWPPQHEQFIRAMNRLAQHPLAFLEKDFIFSFRTMAAVSVEDYKIPELMFGDDGRPFMEAEGSRKKCAARVVVRGRGSGLFTVNGQPPVEYFHAMRHRSGMLEMDQLMYPLQVTGLLDSVDVQAVVEYLGPSQWDPLSSPSARAGAIRYALALALRSFVDADTVDTMRVAGLLSRDVRYRERKKPGKRGARRGRTWKKR